MDYRADLALERALALGAWERDVVGRIAWLAMFAWDELSASQQQQTWALIKQALEDPSLKRSLVRIAADTGWSGYLKQLERENSRAETK